MFSKLDRSTTKEGASAERYTRLPKALGEMFTDAHLFGTDTIPTTRTAVEIIESMGNRPSGGVLYASSYKVPGSPMGKHN